MQFAPAAAAGAAPPRAAPQIADSHLPPAEQHASWGAVPVYASQRALVATPQHAFALAAAPQHRALPPPPPFLPPVPQDSVLAALERALAPSVEPTPSFLELESWVESHVANVGRRRSVLDAAESLEDLRACDAEELEEILNLGTWPRLARQRFLGAWRLLKGEEEEEEHALVPFALPTFAVGALVDADWQGRGNFFPAVVEAAHGDGSYRVAFDDGAVEERTDRVRASPWRRDGTPWVGRPLLCPWGRIGASACTCAAALVKWLPADGNTPALYRVECRGVHAGARMDLQAPQIDSCARAYQPPPRAPFALAAPPVLDPDRAALAARVARAGRAAMDVDGGDGVATPFQDDDIEVPGPAADDGEPAPAIRVESEDDEAPPRQKRARAASESEPVDGAASDDDEPVDGSALFPLGAWVRHTTLGTKGVVVGVLSEGRQRVLCVDKSAMTWVLGTFQSAPGAPPEALAAEAAARSSKQGDWVLDKHTGAKGVIVEVSTGGWRSILCGNDEELKRQPRSFRLADGAPPATLVAKAAAWRRPATQTAPPRPLRKPAAPADAESSEDEEEDEALFPVGAWVRHASTGAKGVVLHTYGTTRQIRCADGTRTTWGVGTLQPAPGAVPAALAAEADMVGAEEGTWVSDTETRARGVIVRIERGIRTMLCGNGQKLKRVPRLLRRATGAPPAALVAKAKLWGAPARTPKPKPKPPARQQSTDAPPRAARVKRTQQRSKHNAPEDAIFDNAVKLYGEWRSQASPSSPGGRSPSSARPMWTVWRADIRLLDEDDTPLRKKGAWQVRWTDRTESFVTGSDVRICVPTRERLRTEAQAPAPKRARRVTESPQPRLPGPAALSPEEYAGGAAPAPPVGGLRATPPVPRPRSVGGTKQRTVSADTRTLAEYLRVCGAQDPETLAGGWSFTYNKRSNGDTAGTSDRYYHPPGGGKQLRSMADVARWHGLAPKARASNGSAGLSDEEKRERREARFMAQHDKEALLIIEVRAMAQHDKRSTRGGHPVDRRDWHAVAAGGKKDITPVTDGLITRVRRNGQVGLGVCARLAVGGVFLQSRFDIARQAENALKVTVSAQRCVCGRSEGGDYVKCAGGAAGRCHGVVHRRCVGLMADEDVPEGWLCPLCDSRSVASKLSVYGSPLATPSGACYCRRVVTRTRTTPPPRRRFYCEPSARESSGAAKFWCAAWPFLVRVTNNGS